MHRFNGQGDKQWRINNAAQWHWPYFVPFNLHWYFDAQCPCHSLAHRRIFFLHTLCSKPDFFFFFKERKKRKQKGKSDRDTSCLVEIALLPKIHLGLLLRILGLYTVPHPPPPTFKEDCGNAHGRFSETMGMLSVCLTTSAGSWAHASEVNSERLWRGIKKAEQQPPLHLLLYEWRGGAWQPRFTVMSKDKCVWRVNIQ